MVKPEIKVLANDDLKTFIEAASKNKYKNIFLIDLFTGLRQSEILGLTWSCIDWENSRIIVKAQLQREKKAGGKYYLTTLKNDKTRTICVAPTVMELLRQRKEFQEWERIAAHTAWFEDIPGLVFETPTGKHLSHTTVRNNFKKVVTEIGMSEVRFHDLRHSFAVACLQNGDDVKTVQGNLGHYTSSFTLDTYGHVTQKMETESAQRMEQYIQTYAQNR
jgi:integrase